MFCYLNCRDHTSFLKIHQNYCFFKRKKERIKKERERREKGEREGGKEGEGRREGRKKRGRKKEKSIGYINKTEVKIFMKYIFHPYLLNFHM